MVHVLTQKPVEECYAEWLDPAYKNHTPQRMHHATMADRTSYSLSYTLPPASAPWPDARISAYPEDVEEVAEMLEAGLKRLFGCFYKGQGFDMDKQTIITTIGPELYARESAAAYERAPFTGQSFTPPAVNYDFFFKVNDMIWEDDAPDDVKMQLAFEVYRDLPAYSLLMPMSLGHEQHSEGAKVVFWQEVRTHLAGESAALAEPLCYTLWCDYFELPERVGRAWRELLVEPNDRVIRRVLEIAGPVPFDLKAPLYQELLPDKRWHADILTSLHNSCFDSYGWVDKDAARELLGQLEMDGEDERVRRIHEFLSK